MDFKRVHLSCFNPFDVNESTIVNLFSCSVDPSFNEECVMLLRNNGFICDQEGFGIEMVEPESGEVIVQYAKTLDAAVKGFMAYKAQAEDVFYTLEIDLF